MRGLLPLFRSAASETRSYLSRTPHARRLAELGRAAPAWRASRLRFELLEWEALADRSAEWSALAAQAIEPNVFLDPRFAQPAAQQLVTSRTPRFLVASTLRAGGERAELLSLWPLIIPRRGFGVLARAWIHPYATSGTPLLAPSFGLEAFDFMLEWLAVVHSHIAGIEFSSLAEDGPAATLIRACALASGRGLRILDRRDRAILTRATPAPETSLPEHACRPRTLHRQWRKLSQLGELRYVSRSDPSDVRTAIETFLVLETSGWKGLGGTALLSEPAVTAFARTITRLLAQKGRCRIESLELDGAPLAMLIVFASGDRAFTWKIAYDEAYAAYSPGAQLIFEFSARQRRDPSVRFTDSCADPANSLVDRLWPDRMKIADFVVAASRDHSAPFHSGLAREIMRRALRRRAKTIYTTARRKSRD